MESLIKQAFDWKIFLVALLSIRRDSRFECQPEFSIGSLSSKTEGAGV